MIRRFAIIAALICWVTLLALGQPIPAPTKPLTVYAWRVLVRPGDVDRVFNSVHAFPVSGTWTPVQGYWQLSDQFGHLTPVTQLPMPANRRADDMADFADIIVPNVTPGSYTLEPGNVAITIEPPAAQPAPIPLQPGSSGPNDSVAIQAAVNAVGNVHCGPGTYYIDSSIDLEGSNPTITGEPGLTRFVRIHNPNDYGDRFFYSSNGAVNPTISGIDFDGSGVADAGQGYPILFHCYPTPTLSLEISRVKTDEVNVLQAVAPGAWIHGSEFDRSICYPSDRTLWQNDKWVGLGWLGDEIMASGTGICFLDDAMVQTGRGFNLRGVTGLYACGITLDGINGLFNGSELVNNESPTAAGTQGSVFSDFFIENCRGQFWEQANTPAGNLIQNTVKNVYFLSGNVQPVLMYGSTPAGNTFINWNSAPSATRPSQLQGGQAPPSFGGLTNQ